MRSKLPRLSLRSDYRTALDNPNTQFKEGFITEPINTNWRSNLNRRNINVKREMSLFQKSRKGGGSGPGQLQKWFK